MRASDPGPVEGERAESPRSRASRPPRRMSRLRGVAQPGSAPHWGCGGRRFKSGRPDQSRSGIVGIVMEILWRFAGAFHHPCPPAFSLRIAAQCRMPNRGLRAFAAAMSSPPYLLLINTETHEGIDRIPPAAARPALAEGFTAKEGRLGQRLDTGKRIGFFGAHPLHGDAWRGVGTSVGPERRHWEDVTS